MAARDELGQLKLIQSRVPKFYGVVPEGGKFRAAIKENGKLRILGYCDTALEAFRMYRKARRPRREKLETTAEVERLLAMAAAFPTRILPDASLIASTMDWKRNRNWKRLQD